jgi:diadenosine tetraphosphate (Ap4A) HIT family hydrolase
MFELDPRLEADTTLLLDLPLCTLRLAKNSTWPWLILVPRAEGAAEIIDLTPEQRTQLWHEIEAVAAALKTVTSAYKLNIGALGNVVRQLHIHVIARFEGDAAWPAPIWGTGHTASYAPDKKAAFEAALLAQLKPLF